MVLRLRLFGTSMRALSLSFTDTFKGVPSLCSSCTSERKSSTLLVHPKTDQSLLSSRNHFVSMSQTCQKTNWRNPSKRQSKSTEYDSDLDSDDEFVLKEQAKTTAAKVMKVQIDNLRVDAIIKHAFGVARNKSEVLFYENRIRINGKRPQKKSTDTNIGDEVDIIKGISHDNGNFIVVWRVEILQVRPSGDYLVMTIRKQKNMVIENYKDDPWVEKGPETSEEEQSKGNDMV